MSNWERKSKYLLREIVKFRTYIDCLEAASKAKEEVVARRAEREAAKARFLAPTVSREDYGSDGMDDTPTKAEFAVEVEERERDITPRAAQFPGP